MADKADIRKAGMQRVQPLAGERERCPLAIASFFAQAEQPAWPVGRDAQPLAAVSEADLP
jgi:hypothetical protein